jgi:MYXO-CTERM domain-containing protein
MFKKTVVAAAFGLVALQASAAITLASTPSNADVVSTIVGSGITAFAPTVNWDAGTGRGVTTFTDGTASVGFSDGVVLTTGNMGCVQTGNASGNCTSPSSGSLGSKSSVSFSFTVTQGGTLSFAYVFASEEYENTNPNNDFANFLLTGASGTVDLAAGKSTSVTSVNCGSNASQFIDNAGAKCSDSGQTRDIEFDGITTVQTATAVLTPGTYTFEFKINDAGSGFGGPNLSGDSALFLQAGSFIFTTPGGPDPVPEPATWALAALGLVAASATRRRRAS